MSARHDEGSPWTLILSGIHTAYDRAVRLWMFLLLWWGLESAWGEFISRYGPGLEEYLKPIAARRKSVEGPSEAVLQVFLEAIEKIGDYDPQVPFDKWLQRLGENYLKRLNRHPWVTNVSSEEWADPAQASPDKQVSLDEPEPPSRLEQILRPGLLMLSDYDRMLLYSHHVCDRSIREITEEINESMNLNKTEGAVKKALHDARKRLHKAVGPHQDELKAILDKMCSHKIHGPATPE